MLSQEGPAACWDIFSPSSSASDVFLRVLHKNVNGRLRRSDCDFNNLCRVTDSRCWIVNAPSVFLFLVGLFLLTVMTLYVFLTCASSQLMELSAACRSQESQTWRLCKVNDGLFQINSLRNRKKSNSMVHKAYGRPIQQNKWRLDDL